MHRSAMQHGEAFFKTYCTGDFSGKTIVDVGAQDVNGSLRTFCPKGATYIGIDFAEGRGVDIVINDPYYLPFEDNMVDVIVCSSVFEHSEFFWLLFLECIRILKPSGLMYLNVPSNGMVHRFPVDSWRFYPDAGRTLSNWANYNAHNTLLLESFLGDKQGPIESEGMWNDFVAIFLKDEKFADNYPRRTRRLTKHFYHSHPCNPDVTTPQYKSVPDHQLILNQEFSIADLRKVVTDLEDTISNKNREIEEKNRVLAAVKNSRSWRLTKPLRVLSELMIKRSAAP